MTSIRLDVAPAVNIQKHSGFQTNARTYGRFLLLKMTVDSKPVEGWNVTVLILRLFRGNYHKLQIVFLF